jgi:tetratricopeptide (TPR) repeat protein
VKLAQSPDANTAIPEGMTLDPEFADWMIELYVSDLTGSADTKETRARFLELADIAAGLGRRQALARIWLRLARIRVQRGEFKGAEEMLGKAQEVATDIHDEALVAEIYTVRAGAQAALEADTAAVAALERQEGISRRLGCWSLLARGLNIGAELALRRKDLARALELAREAEALGRDHQLPDEVERASFAQGVALRRQGKTKTALERFVTAEECLRAGMRRSPLDADLSAKLAENLVMQAALSVDLGDCGGAHRLAEEAAQISQRFPAARNRRFIESSLKWVREKCP